MESINCSSFGECVKGTGSPLPAGSPAEKNITSVQLLVYFFINFAIYVIYAVLLVFVFYNLAIGIYKIVFGEDSNASKIAKESITKSVLGVIGLIVITSILYIIINLLRLIGLPYEEIHAIWNI